MDLEQLRPQVNSILWYKRHIAELEAELSEVETYAATQRGEVVSLRERIRELEAERAD